MPYRDVFGHRRLLHLLARSVHRGSLPPSLILAGPEGVGKRLVAIATAQALNCTSLAAEPTLLPAPTPTTSAPPSAASVSADALEIDACGRCSACTRIVRGGHPDVLIVEPGDSGSIKIDQVRDLVERSGYKPFEGRRRVVIVDDADALVVAAQNALLKTLEEPTPSSVFMLVTSRPDMLLATVRSRCPRLTFRALAPDEVAGALMRQGRSETEARAVAATADGSVGQALSASAGRLVEVREVAVRVLAQAAAHDEPRRRIEGAKDLLEKTGVSGASDREQLAAHLRAMASIVRDAALLSTRADVRALANADVQSDVARLTAFQGGRGLRAYATIGEALSALDRNAGVKVVADWVVLSL